MQYDILYSCISHIGNVRKNNQDNFICDNHHMEIDNATVQFPLSGCANSKQRVLFGVFDGMGGEERGEVASFIAATSALKMPMTRDGVFSLTRFCDHANSEICKFAEDNGISAMGTTAAMLLFLKNKITLCNIGDSKIFRFYDDKLEQISKDHITASAFGRKPPLTQNLGIPPELLVIDPYFSRGQCIDGDRYLICSDGLTDMLSNDQIANILKDCDIEQTALKLVEESLKNGGKDNITVILLEIKKTKYKFLNNLKNIGGKTYDM